MCLWSVVIQTVVFLLVVPMLCSREGDGDEGSDGDVDLFPFDPKDATEPVEV